MRFKHIISAIDSHTEGEPARVVIGGVPHVPGDTMQAKWLWAREHLDDLRTMLMFEPRGSAICSGSIITAPATPGADLGIIFIETSGFLPMCGHGAIAAATVIVEAGLVEVTEPVTHLMLDTPAGLVKARISVEDGIAKDVTIQNVPSFAYCLDAEVDAPGLGRVKLDIGYGGNFYAVVEAAQVGLEIDPAHAREVVDIGNVLREAIYEQIPVQHPENPEIGRCSHVRFIAPPKDRRATTRNAVLYSAEAIDRSPCGTGTSAEMAVRHARGLQQLGDEFVSESIIGSLFFGNLVEETRVGPFAAVVPTIRGSAYISGIQQFVLDPRDPWPHGFFMGARSRWGTEL
jgi:proline racemase